jgi:hypothetical protein
MGLSLTQAKKRTDTYFPFVILNEMKDLLRRVLKSGQVYSRRSFARAQDEKLLL